MPKQNYYDICTIFIHMSEKTININVNSEIGKLEAVIVHTPGQEVENMTPENIKQALYGDILNLNILKKEYDEFKAVLAKHTRTFEVSDLLADVLENEKVKESFIAGIFENENIDGNKDFLLEMDAKTLSKNLIEGVKIEDGTFSEFLSNNDFLINPLYNLLYTRDISIAINHHVFVGQMANTVRSREAKIMETIFNAHPLFKTTVVKPKQINKPGKISYEGGDILIAREDVTLIGMGGRTNSHGIDFIVNQLLHRKTPHHIIVQELPTDLESFIHLDMVFTFLSQTECMVFEPLILETNRYRTIHILIENGKIQKIETINNILTVLKSLGIDLKPILCGGNDTYTQKREQWHSGANFFALAPGKIIGYERNIHTIESLNNNGFEVLKAQDVASGKINTDDYKKYVVAIKGSELARGGGGARCMTMPVLRETVNWK